MKSAYGAVIVGVMLVGAGSPVLAQDPTPAPNPAPFIVSPSPPGDFVLSPFSPDFTSQIHRLVESARSFALDASMAQPPDTPEKPEKPPRLSAPFPPRPPMPTLGPLKFGSSEALYEEARSLIDRSRYEQAIDRLNRLMQQFDGNAQAIENRVDAALYWKAYSEGKQQQIANALGTLADMEKRFVASRWLKDAKALELELRQASGQAVSPDSQSDDDLKLLALRSVMRSDPDRAVPIVERILAGNSSVNVKENALFVLSQSRSPRTKEIITNTAKNSTNPDLQLRAVRYLGAMGEADTRQTLDEIYRSSSDVAVKRAILRAFMTAGDRGRLVSLARSERSPELRDEAVQQLGALHADAELSEIYQGEASIDVKKRILQAMFSSGNVDRMTDIAKTEKDTDLRRSAIRDLGLMNAARTSDVLRSMYASDNPPEIRKEIINALYRQKNAAALVELARAEKDPAMKNEIVTRLSTMRSKEATDYLLELLK